MLWEGAVEGDGVGGERKDLRLEDEMPAFCGRVGCGRVGSGRRRRIEDACVGDDWLQSMSAALPAWNEVELTGFVLMAIEHADTGKDIEIYIEQCEQL